MQTFRQYIIKNYSVEQRRKMTLRDQMKAYKRYLRLNKLKKVK